MIRNNLVALKLRQRPKEKRKDQEIYKTPENSTEKGEKILPNTPR
jgi:hypothetical protein